MQRLQHQVFVNGLLQSPSSYHVGDHGVAFYHPTVRQGDWVAIHFYLFGVFIQTVEIRSSGDYPAGLGIPFERPEPLIEAEQLFLMALDEAIQARMVQIDKAMMGGEKTG